MSRSTAITLSYIKSAQKSLKPNIPTTISSQQSIPAMGTVIARSMKMAPAKNPNQTYSTLSRHISNPLFIIASRSFQTTAVTRSQKYRMIELDEIKYEKLSSQALESLTEYLEDLGDQMVDNEEFDIEYSQGVLTLRTGNAGAGVYVLNKQPPNKQIWLSSPISGPERYDYDASHDAWFCRHTDQSLGQLLKSELTEIFGQDIEIPIN